MTKTAQPIKNPQPLSRELILSRRNAYLQEADKLHNALTATQGAIQNCDYWLGVLDGKIVPPMPKIPGVDDQPKNKTAKKKVK